MTRQEKFDLIINYLVAQEQSEPYNTDKKLTRYSQEMTPVYLGVFSALVNDDFLNYAINIFELEESD